MQGTSACVVEDTIHRQEGWSGRKRRGEAAATREAIVKAPREEHGLSDDVVVRQAARCHTYGVGQLGKVLKAD